MAFRPYSPDKGDGLHWRLLLVSDLLQDVFTDLLRGTDTYRQRYGTGEEIIQYSIRLVAIPQKGRCML